MTAIDHLSGILALSGGFWMILGLCVGLSIQRFIVNRYEQETDLSQTLFFSQYMPFAKYLPDFFSSPLYIGHLLSFVWGWKLVKYIKENRNKVKYYDDINSPEDVIRHFSNKEILKVKWFAISCLIIAVHMVAYYIFGFIWPEVFN
jgi:hypothetical protein